VQQVRAAEFEEVSYSPSAFVLVPSSFAHAAPAHRHEKRP
jgi:hypothetical protein